MGEQTVGATPAGWYPQPGSDAGTPMRWWSGTRWTEHVLPQDTAHPATAPAVRPDASAQPGSRRWGTVWVWLLAVSPWLTFTTGLFAFRAFITVTYPDWHWVVLLLVPYLLVVGLAVFDVKQLRQWHSEVAHWTWSLLGAPAYLIARTVVFRRRGRFGSIPMWVGLGNVLAVVFVVVGLVGVVLWIIARLSESMSSG